MSDGLSRCREKAARAPGLTEAEVIAGTNISRGCTRASSMRLEAAALTIISSMSRTIVGRGKETSSQLPALPPGKYSLQIALNACTSSSASCRVAVSQIFMNFQPGGKPVTNESSCNRIATSLLQVTSASCGAHSKKIQSNCTQQNAQGIDANRDGNC